MSEQIEALTDALKQSQRIVFFGGAGVSTESGIPDFRSADGIFMQETGNQYRPEQIISHSFFKRFPAVYFDFHFDKLVYPSAQPNLAHTFLVELEKMGKDVSVVTQNIDGLHQLAGSSKVYELHGSVYDNYCLTCGRHYLVDQLQRDEAGIPRCPEDGGIVRPNIVMYEEPLDQQTIMQAIDAIRSADLLIVAGTSLVVYPAASFINYFQGDQMVIINKSPLQVTYPGALVFEDSISHVFSQVEL